ncbi:MAG TPA: cytochrome c [Gammaproteobacteria bacterium]|nr:cytochrome c [Gammaproteobacteria bacterium]
MIRSTTLPAALLMATLLAACDYHSGEPEQGPAGTGPGGGQRVVAAPQDRSPAAEAFRQHCSKCHGLPEPESHTAGQWPLVVVRMRQHMRDGADTPSDETLQEIVSYLQARAGPD